jgi:hypothetical protein
MSRAGGFNKAVPANPHAPGNKGPAIGGHRNLQPMATQPKMAGINTPRPMGTPPAPPLKAPGINTPRSLANMASPLKGGVKTFGNPAAQTPKMPAFNKTMGNTIANMPKAAGLGNTKVLNTPGGKPMGINTTRMMGTPPAPPLRTTGMPKAMGNAPAGLPKMPGLNKPGTVGNLAQSKGAGINKTTMTTRTLPTPPTKPGGINTQLRR